MGWFLVCYYDKCDKMVFVGKLLKSYPLSLALKPLKYIGKCALAFSFLNCYTMASVQWFMKKTQWYTT